MKILFTDLDETLLNENSSVSPRTKEIIDRFTKAGNIFVLSSGRSLDSVKEVQEKAGLFYPGMYLVAYNGCLIYSCDEDKNILEYRLPFSTVDYLQEAATRAGIHIQTYTDHEIVALENDEHVQFYKRRIHQNLILTDRFTSVLTREPCKMLAIDIHDPKKLEKLGADLAHWNASHGVQTFFSNPYLLEFIDIRAGKGSAVKYLCEHLGIDIADSYAAGDQENDISMLQAAGCGIAMKNAVPQVLRIADAVTQYDNTEDGLARYIEKYIL